MLSSLLVGKETGIARNSLHMIPCNNTFQGAFKLQCDKKEDIKMPYELLELPYAYNALEPFHVESSVNFHYDVHHRAYVDAFNNIKGYLEKNRSEDNNLLHSIFWQNMCPGGSGSAQGILDEQIVNDFGSFENFKEQFTAAAVAVEGSGWTLLVWSPSFKELEILQAVKNQDLTQWGVIPLLIVDVREHAYYRKYQNKRASWVKAWWNLVNWENVLKRFEDIVNTVQW